MNHAAAMARRRRRYVADVLAVNDRMSLRGLASHVPPESLLYLARRPGGLVVLVARADGMPERYLLGIHGFRLAQYLRLEFASHEIAFDRALFAEPPGQHGQEIHVLAMDEGSGAIFRYMSLLGSADPLPMSPADPRRALFPCEVAHRTNLFDHVPLDDGVDTSHIWEAKRLVRRAPAESGLATRLRLTLELTLGFYTALSRMQPSVKVLVGDGEEGVAITRLARSLPDVSVVEGTVPSLPDDDLMRGLYTQREVVKPFVAKVPQGAELHELIRRVELALADRDPLAGFKTLVGHTNGQPRRVQSCISSRHQTSSTLRSPNATGG